MAEPKPRRKTTTSTEVKQRWKDRNYKSIRIYLRYDQDQPLLDYIETHKEIGTTELFRLALKEFAQRHP